MATPTIKELANQEIDNQLKHHYGVDENGCARTAPMTHAEIDRIMGW